MSRLLGVDYGTVRVGLAVSDADRKIASPLTTYTRRSRDQDADALAERMLIATTNAGGAGKWHDTLSPYFKGRRVVILPDNDAVGRAQRLIPSREVIPRLGVRGRRFAGIVTRSN